jgi:starch-binding outer membrane protein, SusD/RagB family
MKNIHAKIKLFASLVVLAFVQISCSNDFLNLPPQATVSSEQLNTPENIDGMVIAAYAELGNDHYTAPNSLWPYADITSGDAYKGGDGTGDIQEFNFLELFKINTPNNPLLDQKWYRLYVGISRCNEALKRLEAVTEVEVPKKKQRMAEVRFLRGHQYFLLKTMFNRIPWIDETIEGDGFGKVSNADLTSKQLWDNIAAEFQDGVANLPETQADAGRPNKFTAMAYLAKVKLYMAFEQDETNNVNSINAATLNEVVTLTDQVINSGKYSLFSDFAYNFLWEMDKNSSESVFAIQRSINDGTPKGRLDWGNALNYPMNPEYGCCGFHIGSQNLMNSFKTDGTKGLPLFDTFNNANVVEGADFKNNTFDVRIDHTLAVPGKPYKYDPNFIYEQGWSRSGVTYGHFASLKEVQHYTCACFQKVPPFMAASKNTDIIRYADVLLWKAEALIELGRQNEALPIINEIRTRAMNSTNKLKDKNGAPVSNYFMDTYKPGVNCTWSQDFARTALRWERRLEFAMEGIRFFDLVRWGIAAEYLNKYFAEETPERQYLKDAQFTKNKHEYFPIPQKQIDFSKGLYKQNYGW